MKSDRMMWLTRVVILLFAIFLTACKEEVKELEYPLGGPIPQSDIVFMPDANPDDARLDSKTLGFINADGSNRQEYTFTLVGGALSNFGQHIPTQYASYPHWSMDGDEIVFSIRDLPPNIRLIDRDGRMYGQHCRDVGPGETFDLRGNVFIWITPESPFYDEYKDVADTSLIARYDLKACEIVDVFSVPVPLGYLMGEIQEAENGLLTTSFWDTGEQMYKILVYHVATRESQTLPGYHPSLTKDGAMLAYYNNAGELVVRDLTTGEERNLLSVIPAPIDSYDSMVSMPGWSPDNQWLVYNTVNGDIFKINIETGENIYLTYGWAPDWR